MKIAEIQSVNWEDKDLHVIFRSQWKERYRCRHMTDGEFQNFHNNVVVLIDQFLLNKELNNIMGPKGRAWWLVARKRVNGEKILRVCFLCLKEYPLKIKDFNTFIITVTSKYFEYVNYYYELYLKSNDDVNVYISAMFEAEYKLKKWLTDILKEED